MTEDTGSPPRWQQAQTGPGRIVLTGQWTLAHALAISEQLRAIPDDITAVDASKIGRLDSAGVMQLMPSVAAASAIFWPCTSVPVR